MHLLRPGLTRAGPPELCKGGGWCGPSSSLPAGWWDLSRKNLDMNHQAPVVPQKEEATHQNRDVSVYIKETTGERYLQKDFLETLPRRPSKQKGLLNHCLDPERTKKLATLSLTWYKHCMRKLSSSFSWEVWNYPKYLNANVWRRKMWNWFLPDFPLKAETKGQTMVGCWCQRGAGPAWIPGRRGHREESYSWSGANMDMSEK